MSIWTSMGEGLDIPDRDTHDGHHAHLFRPDPSSVDVAAAPSWNDLVRLCVSESGEAVGPPVQRYGAEATVYLTIPEAEALRALLQAAIEHIQKLR